MTDSDCVDCRGGSHSPENRRLAVPAIGRKVPDDQPESDPMQEQIAAMSGDGTSMALVMHLYNMLKRVQVENLALRQVLVSRGLVTEKELMSACATQSQLVQSQFDRQSSQLTPRQPGPRPVDPRQPQ